MNPSRFSILGLVLGPLLFLTSPVVSQSPQVESEPVQGEAEPEGPKAIPAPEIVRHAQQARGLFSEIRSALQDSTRLKPILETLPITASQIDTLEESMGESLDNLRARKIKILEDEWARFDGQLRGWSGYLEDRLQKLYEWDRQIQEHKEVWELTWDAARAEKLPKAVLDRIREVHDDIDAVDRELRERISLFLGLQSTIAELQVVVEVNRRAVQASGDRAGRWFTRDSPPIWKEGSFEEGEASLGDQISENRKQLRTALARFWDEYHDRIYLNLAILGVLFLILATLNWRLRRWQVDEELEKARYFLSRPLASALLLAIFVSVFLYPNIPMVATEIIALLLLYPFARMLPGLTPPRLHKILIPVGFIFLLHRVESVVLEYTLLHRLILLFMDLLSLVVAVWVVRSGVLRSGQRSIWQLAARLLPLVALLMGVALLANTWGVLSLAMVLSDATLSSVFLSVALWLILRILDAVLVVTLQTQALRTFRSVQRHAKVIHRKVMVYTELGIGVFWVARVLGYFRVEDTVWGILTGIFNKSWTVGTVEISVGGIVVFFFAIWLSFQISKLIRFFLEEDILYRAGVSTGIGQNISMGIHYVIIGFGFLVALAAAGVELSRLTILFGALGVGIGFGLQNLVNNFVSGLILMFERPIQVGDTVQVGTLTGRVLRISIRASTVKTFDGAEVIVPNGNLIAGELINWTRTDRLRRVEVKVGVKYGSDPEQILALLVDTARGHEHVLEHPEPFGMFQAFGENALEFSLFFWTSNDRWWTTRSEITLLVSKALKEAGVVIPFPQRDLHIKSGEMPSVGPSE